jgi:hypothetical protein
MYVRGEAGHNKWRRKRNEDILKELRIEPVTDCIKHYQENCRRRG